MPKIKTPNGVMRYKTRPLFPGVKQIDKKIALENLFIVKQIFDTKGIPFMLSYGTLLGAVREHDFIAHDEDIDLSIKDEYRELFLGSLPDLYEAGFELVRYDRRDLYSIMRNGEYIDFYFFKPVGNGVRTCSGSFSLEEFFEKPDTVIFFGTEFTTHSNHMDYILFEYGESWHTPIQWNDYNMPKWKLCALYAKEYMKDIMPDWLFYKLSAKASDKLRIRYEKQLKKYKELKKRR